MSAEQFVHIEGSELTWTVRVRAVSKTGIELNNPSTSFDEWLNLSFDDMQSKALDQEKSYRDELYIKLKQRFGSAIPLPDNADDFSKHFDNPMFMFEFYEFVRLAVCPSPWAPWNSFGITEICDTTDVADDKIWAVALEVHIAEEGSSGSV